MTLEERITELTEDLDRNTPGWGGLTDREWFIKKIAEIHEELDAKT